MTSTDMPMKLAAAHVSPDPSGVRRRSTLGRAFAAALALALFTPSPSAFAADAEALLKEGKKLASEKKYEEACPKLAESYKLSPAAGTLIELALCHEKQGKLATAWGELLDAETEARKAGRADLEARARGNSKSLEGKLPRVTVNVAQNTAGLEIAIDGQKIDMSALGKGRPVDPGEHKIVASAPGKKPFETTLTLKQAEKKTVIVPALADDPNASTQAKPEDKPTGTTPDQATQTADTKTGTGDKTGDPKQDKPPVDPDDGKGPIHRPKRIVIDVGVMAGGQVALGGGSLGELSNLNYEYRITDQLGLEAGELAACNSSVCRATTDPAIGIPVGGQLFVGYAVDETTHIGGRFFGSYLVTGGYSLFIGPSLSKRVKERLWLGGTLLVGFGSQSAPITGAKGEVPDQWVDLNGTDEVDVELDRSIPPEGIVGYGFTFGLSGELSIRLAEFGKGKSLSTGSLVLSAWPTVLKTWNGFAATLPIGLGYRFH
jgi:hypothetical protein